MTKRGSPPPSSQEERGRPGFPAGAGRPPPPGFLLPIPEEGERRQHGVPPGVGRGARRPLCPGSQGGQRERGESRGHYQRAAPGALPPAGDEGKEQEVLRERKKTTHHGRARRQQQPRPPRIGPPAALSVAQQQRPPQFELQMVLQPRPTVLFNVDKSPASFNTKWEELHPASQNYLLRIEARILQYRSESQRLDECARLYGSSVANSGFELDAACIFQELGGISMAMERKKNLVQVLMTSVKHMMRNTEFAIHSFVILHPSSVRADDFYSGVPKRPSPFFIKTVAQFDKYLGECWRWIEVLEQLLYVDTKSAFSSSGTTLECLPSVLSNICDYFIYVAAKMENIHQHIESMKTAYLADQRQQGDANDPFLEATRRETAKLEASARRVHPTLHLSSVPSQPLSQPAGLFASSAMPGASIVQNQAIGGFGGSFGSGFSMFRNPSTSASMSTASHSLFSTPSSSAPTPTLFSSSSVSPQSTPFASAQTFPLCGANNPAFTSAPAIGSSPLFCTLSFASGAAMGSGASLRSASKASKRKSRAPRH